MKKFISLHKWPLLGLVFVFVLIAGVSALALSSSESSADDVLSSFSDISMEDEEFEAITYLQREKIFQGNDDGTFNPDGSLNRAEWATILVRLSGVDPSLDDNSDCFPDVEDEWFAPSVCFAKSQGWITGYEAGDMAGKYGPELPVQDIEALATLARLTGWDVEEDEGDEWYEPALKFAQEKKIYDESEPIKDIARKDIADVTYKMLATVSLDNEEYTDNLQYQVERQGIYALTNVEVENYDGEYEDEYMEHARKEREKKWAQYSEGMCNLEIDIYQAILEAFEALAIDVSETNKKMRKNSPPHYDGYEEMEETTIQCEETGSAIIRLAKDMSVLPTYEEQKRRYKEYGKLQQGNFYYLEFTVFTECQNIDECVCWSTLEFVNLETGEIEAMVTSEQESCSNLSGNLAEMLERIQERVGGNFQNEDPEWSQPDPEDEEPEPEAEEPEDEPEEEPEEEAEEGDVVVETPEVPVDIVEEEGEAVEEEEEETVSESEESVEEVSNMQVIECLPEDRKVSTCVASNEPICAKPVNKTYNNPCEACRYPEIGSYTDGECEY
ncbi:S-layer homology domain-containing protein [Patescibacteria group bacterium]|nr:S-layer homology domain-containing protein [Patescibacteria group bacterium]MBU1682344.1 S-layer homology domain-containing protein [Patescibacteria group bacterium]MBU1934710.1 S-layer homology domain-containing protein [Patescibacteria group bacterium]